MIATVSYELACEADIERLVQFVEEFYTLDGHPFDGVKARQAIADLITHEAYGRLWLIQVEGMPVGYVVVTFGYSLEYQGRDAIVDEIYLQAPYRGQGIGTQTFAFIEAECQKLGIKALHLEVMADNLKAQQLYTKLGYEGRPSHFLHKWLIPTA